MGACVSKCYTDPSIHIDSGVLKEKLVVSESPLPLRRDLSKKEANSSICSSSSASVSSPNPSTSQLAHGSTSSKCSSLILSPKQKTRPAAADAGIVNHGLAVNHQPPLRHPPVARRPPKQSLASCSNQSTPVRRARSCSPAPVVAERKSFTSEGSSRRMSSPPKLGRSRSLVNGRPGRDHVGRRSSSVDPGNPLPVFRRSSSMGKEIGVHQKIQMQLGDRRIGKMEASARQSSIINVRLREELDNPLITMDCFIFL